MGYLARDNTLKKVSLAGEPPSTLHKLGGRFNGATWLDDGTIAYSEQGRLYRVADGGGVASPLVTEADGELTWPAALPGSKAILATHDTGQERSVVLVEVEGGAISTLVPSGNSPRYASSGHLVFARDTFLFAVRFEPATGKVVGDPVPVHEGVRGTTSGAAHYAFSGTGSLAFVPAVAAGDPQRAARRFRWYDLEGELTEVLADSAVMFSPRLSPDGGRIVVQLGGEDAPALYLVDAVRGGSAQRLTPDGPVSSPAWTPDGRWVYFTSSGEAGREDVYRMRSDGSGTAELVLAREGAQVVIDVSSAGEELLVREAGAGGRADLYILQLGGEPPYEQPRYEPLVDTAAAEYDGRFSPDGRLVAYTLRDFSQSEIYIFDRESGARHKVSTDGGLGSVWAPDGSWLAYFTADNEVLAVDVSLEPELGFSIPRRLFTLESGILVDVDPNGERILTLVAERPEEGSQSRVQVILNWFDKIEELAPANP